MPRTIDLRSDTVTQPTQAMRDAMRDAVVGDDILGEDPTVQELERHSAALLGKEAGLFVISGTMANQVAVMALTERGDEILVGDRTHIYNLEVGGLAALSQVQVRTLAATGGEFPVESVRAAIRPRGIQAPITRLLCLEDTFDLNRGIPLGAAYLGRVSAAAREHGLAVYLDGARIFNAAVALGVSPAELAAPADAAMFCLAKGLAAPVGSVIVGARSFIEKARWIRQRIGGGMRQAGHMAAAGLVGLTEMAGRLADDHRHARMLAEGIARVHSSLVDLDAPMTNIVNVNFRGVETNAADVARRLADFGILVKVVGEHEARAVTHHGIERPDVEAVVAALRRCLAPLGRA